MATFASRTENWASALARRMSQAAIRSTPPPMQQPWMAAMTGTGQSATEVIEACRRMISARALGGPGGRRGRGCRRAPRRAPADPRHGDQVEPDARSGALGRHDDGPHLAVGSEGGHGHRQVVQNAGPMALRFSARSSHRVATWPSTSMERTSEENESMVGALMAASVGRARTVRPATAAA